MLRPTLRRLARGLTRRPSPTRKAFRPRLSLEGLETRLTPAVHVSVVGGVLTAQVDKADKAFNTVTVDHVVQSGKGFAEINGHFFSDAAYNSIQINGGSGGLTANIHANVKPLTVSGVGTKNVDNLGDATNKLQGIQATVLLENESSGGSSTVNINDQNDATLRNVTMSKIKRAGDSSLGAVNGLGAAQITWDYQDTSAVNLNLGSGADNLNVLATGVTTNVTTNIFHPANASINVGNNSMLTDIQGNLNLENDGGSVHIFFDDTNDSASRTYNLGVVPGDEFVNTFGRLSSNAMTGAITWDNADTNAVVLFGGSGGNRFNIAQTGVGPTVEINGGSGVNFFDLIPPGTPGFLGSNLQGRLEIFAGGNTNSAIFLNDQNDPKAERFNFFGSPFDASLTLGNGPGFSLLFVGFDPTNGGASLETNQISTVNDPNGVIHVIF